MIWAIFCGGGERMQIAAVRCSGADRRSHRIERLAALAVLSPAAEVRRRAIEDLAPARSPGCRRTFDRSGFTNHGSIRCTAARAGTAGELFVEGERFNI